MARPKSDQTTIKDVATVAGVSPATVSRVLSNPEYEVSEALKQRVLSAAGHLNYQSGGRLRQTRIRAEIGVIVPNITNPLYAQALTGIETIARDYDYGVFVCNSMRDKDREYDYLCEMYHRKIRSVILSSVSTRVDGIREFIDRGMKVVLLDQRLPGLDCAHVNFDMYRGAGLAVQHLVALGHRRIGLATTPLTRWTRSQILQGYQDALTQAGISLDESRVFTSQTEDETRLFGGDFDAGMELGEKITAGPHDMTALVIINSITACGVLKVFKARGIQIPGQLSVVSLDDMAGSDVVDPPLTALRLPVFDAGRIAATIVISRLAQQNPNLLNMGITPELIVRGSTRATD